MIPKIEFNLSVKKKKQKKFKKKKKKKRERNFRNKLQYDFTKILDENIKFQKPTENRRESAASLTMIFGMPILR